MMLRKGFYLHSSFKHLEQSLPHIKKTQEERLREILEEAYKRPFYSDKWSKHGFHPNQFDKLEDIKKIPIIDPDRNQMGDVKKSIDKGGSLLSSGSSGRQRLKVNFGNQPWDWVEAVYLRNLIIQGYRPFRKQHNYWYEKRKNKIRRNIFVPKENILYERSFEEQLEELESTSHDYIIYYPIVLFTLAKKALQSDRNYDISPKAIFTQGEVLTPTMRETIQEAFKAPVHDNYGCTEFHRIAWECPEGDGYHLCSNSVLIEILDENGEEVSAGERGRLVGTTLVNHVTPLVRYDLGDVVMKMENKCACGKSFPKIKKVEGRARNFFDAKNSVVSPYEIIDTLAKYRDLLVFQLVKQDGEVTLKYVPNSNFQQETLKDVEGDLKEVLGIREIEFHEVGELDITEGGKIVSVKNRGKNVV